MPLNPLIARLIAERESDDDYARPGSAPVSISDSRRFHEEDIELFTPRTLRDAVAEVRDVMIPGPDRDIPGRLYRPLMPKTDATLLWFHGGGWVTGSLDTADAVVRALCARTGITIASVDYALAPERLWPHGYWEALAAVEWASNMRPSLGGGALLLVGGDSAGGNLAAAAAIERHTLVDGQLLLYPVVDLRAKTDTYASRVTYGSGYFVGWADIEWAIDLYAPDSSTREDATVSPILSAELPRSPQTIVAAAEFDPLTDENRAYVEKLIRAGVRAKLLEFDGLVHGAFDMMALVPEVDAAMSRIANELATLLAGLRGRT